MDLGLIARLVWRFRRLLIAGFILATLLAAASVWKVSFAGGSPKLTFREQQTWVSYSRLLVTQSGFPQGRTDIQSAVPANATPQQAAAVRQFGDDGRFVLQAMLYAKLAPTAPVRALMDRQGPIPGAKDVSVAAVQDLPLVEISALGESRASAVALARRQAGALRQFVANEQQAGGTPADNRIELQVVEPAGAKPFLPTQDNTYIIQGRSKMRPILIFMVVNLLFFGLAVMLENVNPRLRAVAPRRAPVEDDAPATTARPLRVT